jgi:GH25 family lysozyme M1 (1,4-beta-N-acetylmuramidase)
MTTARGIDVSNWQGAYDFTPWKDEIDYGWVLATEGTSYRDPDFKHDWQSLRDLGKVRLAYHYMLPAQSSPQAQAKYLLEYVGDEGGWRDGDHVILDMENSQGVRPAEVTVWAARFRRTINAAGKRCVFYVDPSFAAAGNCATLGRDLLAVADYSGETPVPKHAPPCPPFREWLFWQYTDDPIDRSIFNGSPAELRKWAGLAA